MSLPPISVDPEKRGDIYYRYKMPPVVTKIEGSGNGIKTVFPNILDVCEAINRPSDVLMKFFQFECGAQRTVSRDQKCWLMGQFTQDRIQKVLDDFVVKYVLCDSCRSPETNFVVEGKRTLSSHCAACGRARTMKDIHRVDTFMINYYMANKSELEKKTTKVPVVAEQEQEAAPAAAPTTAPSDAAQSAAPAAPVSEPKSTVEDDVESPTETTYRIFKNLLASQPDRIEHHCETISTHIRQFLQRYCHEDYFGVVILFYVFDQLFPDRMCEMLQKYHSLIHVFMSASEITLQSAYGDEPKMLEIRKAEAKQRVKVLKEAAKFFMSVDRPYYTIDRLVHCVFVMYIEGLVDASNIAKWLEKPFITKGTSPELTDELYQKIRPLTDWLGTTINPKSKKEKE